MRAFILAVASVIRVISVSIAVWIAILAVTFLISGLLAYIFEESFK